jgi:hypothetical protein
VLEEYKSEKLQPDWDGDVQIAALSATDSGTISQELKSWKGLDWDGLRVKAMRSRAAFKSADAARLTFVAKRETGRISS